MKVVLTKDVKDTGRAHEAVEVRDGHALNFLIPKGMAVPATPAALKNAELRQKRTEEQRVLSAKLVEERLAALSETPLVIRKKANEQGHLYDAVDAKDIAFAVSLPVDAIRIEKPFKELGTHEVPVSVGEGFGKFSITIEAE